MEERTQAVVDALINAMEKREKIARKELSKAYHPNDRFMPGWAREIVLWRERWPRSNVIAVFFYAGGMYKEKTNVDITFLTEEIFDKDIVPALTEWSQKKVDNEKWSGLFDAKLFITVGGYDWDAKEIRVENEERMERRRQLVHDFIANKEYETEDIRKILYSIESIVSIAAGDFYDEFGPETLRAFYDRLMERILEADVVYYLTSFLGAARILAKPKDGRKPTEEMFSLACHLCMSVMIHGDEYRKEYGREALKVVASCGSKEARNILKFGSGLIPPEDHDVQG